MKVALKKIALVCSQCNGAGVIHKEYPVTREGESLSFYGRANLWYRSACDCPACEGTGSIKAISVKLTGEQRRAVLSLYIKNEERKNRQAKAAKTNKPWLAKTKYGDPRYK